MLIFKNSSLFFTSRPVNLTNAADWFYSRSRISTQKKKISSASNRKQKWKETEYFRIYLSNKTYDNISCFFLFFSITHAACFNSLQGNVLQSLVKFFNSFFAELSIPYGIQIHTSSYLLGVLGGVGKFLQRKDLKAKGKNYKCFHIGVSCILDWKRKKYRKIL